MVGAVVVSLSNLVLVFVFFCAGILVGLEPVIFCGWSRFGGF